VAADGNLGRRVAVGSKYCPLGTTVLPKPWVESCSAVSLSDLSRFLVCRSRACSSRSVSGSCSSARAGSGPSTGAASIAA